VNLQNPSAPIPDGHGGYTQAWVDLVPFALFVKIEPATALALERVKSVGTVVAQATHLVTGPYHPQATTQTRLLFNGRALTVVGLVSRDERNVESVMICAEVVR
jgi:head-tail adaptor